MRRTFSFTALVVGLALATAACGSVSPYAAKVDNKSISQDDLERELRSIAANGPYLALIESRQQVKGTGDGTFDAAFTALALTRQIYYELIGTELSKRKLTVGDDDLAAARATVVEQLQGEDVFKDFPPAYQEELIRRQAQLDLLTLSLNGQSGSTEDAARAYYDGNKDSFAQACVSHILVATQEKADEVKGRLGRGEDFAAVARTESTDTQSAAKGGELGCDITQETGFVPEFLMAVFSQPVGEVGNAVKTQFGFHLIKVTAKTVPPYEEAKDAVREKLTTGGQEKLLTWLQETVTAAKIEINPTYGTFNKEATPRASSHRSGPPTPRPPRRPRSRLRPKSGAAAACPPTPRPAPS